MTYHPSLLAEVTRGGRVESVHFGNVAVVDVDGGVRAFAGDPNAFAYFRSSAKPFQAVPLVESGAADRFGFTPAELALCCASHAGERAHQDQVRVMLGKLGLDQSALQCGVSLPSDRQAVGDVLSGKVAPSPLQCECSGKHAGMLTSCLHLGYPIETYLEPEHPLQRAIRSVVAEVCRVAPEDLHLATDGCSVPTFGTTLAAMATAFATLAAPRAAPAGGGREHSGALDRLRAAMSAHPENVGAIRGNPDTDLMRCSGGRLVAKSGAEGLLCVGIPERKLGIAVRIADGSFRAYPVIIAAVLEQLGLIEREVIDRLLALHDPRILNHNRRHVGDLRAAFELRLGAELSGAAGPRSAGHA